MQTKRKRPSLVCPYGSVGFPFCETDVIWAAAKSGGGNWLSREVRRTNARGRHRSAAWRTRPTTDGFGRYLLEPIGSIRDDPDVRLGGRCRRQIACSQSTADRPVDCRDNGRQSWPAVFDDARLVRVCIFRVLRSTCQSLSNRCSAC